MLRCCYRAEQSASIRAPAPLKVEKVEGLRTWLVSASLAVVGNPLLGSVAMKGERPEGLGVNPFGGRPLDAIHHRAARVHAVFVLLPIRVETVEQQCITCRHQVTNEGQLEGRLKEGSLIRTDA